AFSNSPPGRAWPAATATGRRTIWFSWAATIASGLGQNGAVWCRNTVAIPGADHRTAAAVRPIHAQKRASREKRRVCATQQPEIPTTAYFFLLRKAVRARGLETNIAAPSAIRGKGEFHETQNVTSICRQHDAAGGRLRLQPGPGPGCRRAASV